MSKKQDDQILHRTRLAMQDKIQQVERDLADGDATRLALVIEDGHVMTRFRARKIAALPDDLEGVPLLKIPAATAYAAPRQAVVMTAAEFFALRLAELRAGIDAINRLLEGGSL